MVPGVDDGDQYQEVDRLVAESEPLAAFIDQVRHARNVLRNADVGDHVAISFEAKGYPMHGDFDVKIEISIGFGQTVTGTDFVTVLEEAMRRLRFKQKNKPLLMPPA